MSNEDLTSINKLEANSETIETVIGVDTKFVGSVNTTKPIRIDGSFEGEITSDNSVIVTECGKFKGTVSCARFLIDGYGEGKVHCTELCRFAPIGKFRGDIVTKNIVLVEGSELDGTLQMLR